MEKNLSKDKTENKNFKKHTNPRENNNQRNFPQYDAFRIVSKDTILEHGTRFGHQVKIWNPKMKPFIQRAPKNSNVRQRNKIHIINTVATVKSLAFSYKQIEKIAAKDGTFLFVGTNNFSKKTVEENAQRVNAFYVTHRWLGGTLTNFKTIQNSVRRLRTLERLEKENFKGYTKKEGLEMRRELQKLEQNLSGIKHMRKPPSALIVTSIIDSKIAIKEAQKLKIPIFAIADTNTDPSIVNYPIPANDDGSKSVALIITTLTDAIASAKDLPRKVAYLPEDKIEVLGIIERVKTDADDVLGRAKRSKMNRFYTQKEERHQQRAFTQERHEHNEKVEKDQLASLDMTELKKLLKASGASGYSTMKKEELVKFAREQNIKVKEKTEK